MENFIDKYKYSVLKYRHSSFSEECLNVAFIVFFKKENKFFFASTNNLKRINHLYPDFNRNLISNYIKDIEYIIQNLNKKNTLFDFNIDSNLNSFINQNILPLDGSSLIFSKEVNCFRNNLNQKTILNHLTQSLLFNKVEKTKNKISLKNIFYNKVKTFVREDKFHNNPNFFTNYKIENEIGTEFKFDFAWQNGSLNLIKELDLNVANASTISKKSYENFGLLYDLKKTADKKDYKFDFLVTEPQKESLFKEYEHSIRLLDNLPYANIIEKNNFDKYVLKVKENIS